MAVVWYCRRWQLWETSARYEAVHMISDDVLALVQLDPPGIELCRISNMQNEGATNSRCHSSREDGPHMDRLCTLLLPPLRQEPDGTSATITRAFCFGGQSGHEAFSEPWPECHRAPSGRRQIFRPSTRDSVVNVMMEVIVGDIHWYNIDVVIRCDTLLSYADMVHVPPTVSVVPVANGNDNAEEDNENNVVAWNAWGPRATSVELSDYRRVRWRNCFAEQRVTIEEGDLIRIRDYNSYHIQQARDSNVGFKQNGTRRIFNRSEIRGVEWFEEDVTAELPYLDIVVNVQGRAKYSEMYLEQDEVYPGARLAHMGYAG